MSINVCIYGLLFIWNCICVVSKLDPATIRAKVNAHNNAGANSQLINLLDEVLVDYGTLDIDDIQPSLYSYLGVAYHNAHQPEESIAAFKDAVKRYPTDTRSYINMGEQYGQTFRIPEAVEAYNLALSQGDMSALPRLLRVMAWGGMWHNFERITSTIEKEAKKCDYSPSKNVDGGNPGSGQEYCVIDSASGFEYTDLPGYIQTYLEKMSPNARSSAYRVAKEHKAGLWGKHTNGSIMSAIEPLKSNKRVKPKNSNSDSMLKDSFNNMLNRKKSKKGESENNDKVERATISDTSNAAMSPLTSRELNTFVASSGGRRLKIGIISSDFGVHPVATLVRGVVQHITAENNRRIELYAFAVKGDMSWWGFNISAEVEHFIPLHQYKNTFDAARAIAKTKVEILIDLNGHTVNSGLPILAHRPAPIQMSFLGLPVTTGAPFIDYYIGDYVALPPEHSEHFTEKLLLMQPCYISTDHAQLRGKVLDMVGPFRSPRDEFRSDFDLNYIEPMRNRIYGSAKKKLKYDLVPRRKRESGVDYGSPAQYLLGTLSNFQKISPDIFHVWMNVLRRFPSSTFLMMDYEASHIAIESARNNSECFGIKSTRLAHAPQAAWFDHLLTKTGFDLLFDTTAKNGHTTGLDAVWAGVPSMTIGGGASMSKRASESIVEAFESDFNLLTYSLKEYEDLAIDLLKNKRKLRVVREHSEKMRSSSPLFDSSKWTKQFGNILEASWEAVHVSKYMAELNQRTDSETNQGETDEFEPIDAYLNTKPKRNYSDNDVVTPTYHVFASTNRNPKDAPLSALPVRQTDEMGMDIGGDFRSTTELNIVRSVHRQRRKKKRPKLKSLTKTSLDLEEVSETKQSKANSGPLLNPVLEKQKAKKSEELNKNLILDIEEELPPLPDEVYENEYLMLNIGGIMKAEGWINVNAQTQSYGGQVHTAPGGVQLLRDMDNLEGIDDQSVSALYSR